MRDFYKAACNLSIKNFEDLQRLLGPVEAFQQLALLVKDFLTWVKTGKVQETKEWSQFLDWVQNAFSAFELAVFEFRNIVGQAKRSNTDLAKFQARFEQIDKQAIPPNRASILNWTDNALKLASDLILRRIMNERPQTGTSSVNKSQISNLSKPTVSSQNKSRLGGNKSISNLANIKPIQTNFR